LSFLVGAVEAVPLWPYRKRTEVSLEASSNKSEKQCTEGEIRDIHTVFAFSFPQTFMLVEFRFSARCGLARLN
jgi:hypothetical protein